MSFLVPYNSKIIYFRIVCFVFLSWSPHLYILLTFSYPCLQVLLLLSRFTFSLNMCNIIIYVARWWQKYLSKRSCIKRTCSWHDKLIILWKLNRQAVTAVETSFLSTSRKNPYKISFHMIPINYFFLASTIIIAWPNTISIFPKRKEINNESLLSVWFKYKIEMGHVSSFWILLATSKNKIQFATQRNGK